MFIYGVGAELRLLALSFFGTASSAFCCYLGNIDPRLDNDLRFMKMALLYNKLGDRTLTHLALAIAEINISAIEWFKKMGLGKIGVSCNVHQVIEDEGRSHVETVLMTDRRLMCDIQGQEFLYVETSAEQTGTLESEDLRLLLMLLWGHLDIERMNLEGVEFRDPRKDGGCDPDAWGPAARKSRSRYVSEYEATKAAKPGVFGSFRDKVNGLVSRIGGGCRKEGVAIEV